MELAGQRIQAEHENEEVEGIERPAQKTRDECVSLGRIQTSKMSDEFHELGCPRDPPLSDDHFLAQAMRMLA